jgi:dolichol-phosphate mannosyltransferase
MDLSIVIPTYNEKGNIERLLKEVFAVFRKSGIDGEVIVVDDNSGDGTGELVEGLRKRYSKLCIIHRKGKLGLSSAALEGWKIAQGKILGVMDADLSHPPEKIREMFEAMRDSDLVIGSRYVKNGKIVGWNFKRKFMSKAATFLSRPFTSVRDPMTGYFFVRRDCVKNRDLNPKGFKILLEVIIKGRCKRVKEIPITFVNRQVGKSKAGLGEVIFYIRKLMGYLPYKKDLFIQFFKFALVGGLGTVINLAVLYALTEYLGLYYLLSAFFAFLVAVTNNFIWNKVWTFRERIGEKTAVKYNKFFFVSVIALVVNLLFLYFFTEFLGIYYLVSQVLAIALALIINFLGNKCWTFRR